MNEKLKTLEEIKTNVTELKDCNSILEQKLQKSDYLLNDYRTLTKTLISCGAVLLAVVIYSGYKYARLLEKTTNYELKHESLKLKK